MDFLIIEISVGIFAAIILFLYGIENLSNEIQKISSEKLKEIISKTLSNKWIGALIGAVLTAIVQSSTAITVITVSLVNSGIISFSQSLGIIAGANIGTTVTAQLVALNLFAISPLFIILGFLIDVFWKKYRILGKAIFYFGLVFFSLFLISEAVQPLKNNEEFKRFFLIWKEPFVALLAGVIITLILQSSSVVTGIVVILSMQELLELREAIAIIMGANIGTTFTALFASLSLDVFAKRTAIAHLLFNTLGVFTIFPFLDNFKIFIESLGGSRGQMVANAHLIFNVITAIIFLIFSERVKSFIENMIKTNEKEIAFRTKYIGVEIKSTKDALEAVEKELREELEIIREMYTIAFEILKGNLKNEKRLIKLESLCDYLTLKVNEEIKKISKNKLESEEKRKLKRYIVIAQEMEILADVAEKIGNIGKIENYKGLNISVKTLEKLTNFEEKINKLIKSLYEKESKVDESKNLIETIKKELNEEFSKSLKIENDEEYRIMMEVLSLIELSLEKLEKIHYNFE